MNKQNPKKRYFFSAALIVGSVGAIGQTMILYNDLVHSYPFKLMDMPSWQFYANIGQVGVFISATIAIAAAFLFRSIKPYITTTIPVLICPLVYWLTFELFFLFSRYRSEDMIVKNFDGYTGETARYEFAFEVLTL